MHDSAGNFPQTDSGSGLMAFAPADLAHLIANFSNAHHQLAQEQAGQPFTEHQKLLSEAEFAALLLCVCGYAMHQPERQEQCDVQTMATLELLVNAFVLKDTTGQIASFLTSRYLKILASMASTVKPWLPGFSESYESQCQILGLTKNAAVAVSSQYLLTSSIRRWSSVGCESQKRH